MIRRRRAGATVKVQFNTNPNEIPDDDLSLASKLEVHFQPPNAGTEIIITATFSGWYLFATLPFTQHIAGQWQADAYGEFNSGTVVKIGKTVSWIANPKYTYP